MKNIIGLIGYAGVGKDTLADQLVEEGWAKIAFADAMKDLFLVARPVRYSRPKGEVIPIHNREALETAKRLDPGVRQALQNFGMAVRDIDPYFWAAALHGRVRRELRRPEVVGVVITDIRLQNELDFVAELGAVVVRLMRPGATAVNDHISEKLASRDDLPGVITLTNEGGPEKWREVLELATGI